MDAIKEPQHITILVCTLSVTCETRIAVVIKTLTIHTCEKSESEKGGEFHVFEKTGAYIYSVFPVV